MIVNNIVDEDKSKLKRVITENTKPDTVNNLAAGNFGFNNLNSILKNVDEDRVVKYLKIPKTETAKIEDNIDIDAETYDVMGSLVMPGAVDVHVHFREPGFTNKETIKISFFTNLLSITILPFFNKIIDYHPKHQK